MNFKNHTKKKLFKKNKPTVSITFLKNFLLVKKIIYPRLKVLWCVYFNGERNKNARSSRSFKQQLHNIHDSAALRRGISKRRGF